MNIRFIVLTQKTPGYYEKARKEYEKRLSRYCRLKTVTVKTAEKAGKAVDSKAPVVLIRREGTLLSSEEVADLITRAELSGASSVNLVSAEGFQPEDNSLPCYSVSPMSLSPDLVSVVVLEQIYRAYKIINGEKYHK